MKVCTFAAALCCAKKFCLFANLRRKKAFVGVNSCAGRDSGRSRGIKKLVASLFWRFHEELLRIVRDPCSVVGDSWHHAGSPPGDHQSDHPGGFAEDPAGPEKAGDG